MRSPFVQPGFSGGAIGHDIADFRRRRDVEILGNRTMNRPVSTATARMMFMAGPANTMIKRCQRGLLWKLRGRWLVRRPAVRPPS